MIDEKYYNWLGLVILDDQFKKYDFLLKQLFRKEYYWINKMDENRAGDGVYLRYQFCECFIQPKWYRPLDKELGGCRLLEMFVAFSHRAMASISPEKSKITPSELFLLMMEGIGLKKFDEKWADICEDPFNEVDRLMTDFMDGTTFLFPEIKDEILNDELFVQFDKFVQKRGYF